MRPLSHVPQNFRPHAERLRTTGVPCVIRATLGTPYVPAEPDGAVHLDSLLAWAFVATRPYPIRFEGRPASVVPIPPLAVLWVSPEGLPLFAASDLYPQGATLRGREYWHRRYPVDRAELGTRLRASLTAGRWKEYRIPLSTIRAPVLQGLALGDPDGLRDLLQSVSHVGKKGAMGFGRVLEWAVEPRADAPEVVVRTILDRRRVPVAYWVEQDASWSVARAARSAWTPPYWYEPWSELVTVPEA